MKSISFIITTEGNLAKIKDAIVDFTYLSEKKFVGEEPIRENFYKLKQMENGHSKQFVVDTLFFNEFRKLGSSCFEWSHLPTFLKDTCFTSGHTTDKNFDLISHFRKLSESDRAKDISKETLIKLPFILNHKNHINCPPQICIPTADDQN